MAAKLAWRNEFSSNSISLKTILYCRHKVETVPPFVTRQVTHPTLHNGKNCAIGCAFQRKIWPQDQTVRNRTIERTCEYYFQDDFNSRNLANFTVSNVAKNLLENMHAGELYFPLSSSSVVCIFKQVYILSTLSKRLRLCVKGKLYPALNDGEKPHCRARRLFNDLRTGPNSTKQENKASSPAF